MQFCVLASGSKGNALLVRKGKTCVLIDCGLSLRDLRRRLQTLDLEIYDLTALVITHGHSDHVRAAHSLAGPMRLRSYATIQTRNHLAARQGLANWVQICPDTPFQIGDLQFLPFSTPHDIAGSVGFVVEAEGVRLGLCTDLGEPAAVVASKLQGCDTLYLEFNYDDEMLLHGPYPQRLKRRVRSSRGHLSNVQGAALLKETLSPNTQRVILAHLSETNNTISLATAAAKAVVGARAVEIQVAPQHEPGTWVEVCPDRVNARGVKTKSAGSSDEYAAPKSKKPNSPEAVATSSVSKDVAVAVQKQLLLFGE